MPAFEPPLPRSLRLLCLLLPLFRGMDAWAALPPPIEAPVDHFILLFQENHSFDNLLGEFPGADGIAEAGEAAVCFVKPLGKENERPGSSNLEEGQKHVLALI